MISDGVLEQLWNAHEAREATRDSSCFASTVDNNDRRRYLKGNAHKKKSNAHNSHRSLGSISVSGSNEDNSDDIDAEALNMNQMAGTFLVHAAGSAISIIVGLICFWNKKRRRNNKKARQRQVESSESASSCKTHVDNNNINNNNINTLNQDNGCSRRSQLQQFEELTKRMHQDDFHTMLSLMAATKTKET
jgi:hypothetical protein